MAYASFQEMVAQVGDEEAQMTVPVICEEVLFGNDLFVYCLPHPGQDFVTSEAKRDFQRHCTGIYRRRRGGFPKANGRGVPLNLTLAELEQLYQDLPRLIELQRERERQAGGRP